MRSCVESKLGFCFVDNFGDKRQKALVDERQAAWKIELRLLLGVRAMNFVQLLKLKKHQMRACYFL